MSSTKRRPGRPRSPQADESIIEAALHLLHEVGYSALTMEAVAERAGVGKATLYRRYPNKSELIKAAAASEIGTTAPVPDTGSTRRDLRLLLQTSIAVMTATAWGQVIAAIAVEAADNPDVAAERELFWKERFEATTEIVRRGIARGEIRDEVDPQLVIEMALGPIYVRTLVTGTPLSLEFADTLTEEIMRYAGC